MLLLPLHCYDESGRILPPRWLYWFLLLCVADWMVFIFSLALRDQTTTLLSLFYPLREWLGTYLIASIPFLLVLVLLGQRERLWNRGWLTWARLLKPMIVLGLLVSFALQVWHGWQLHWQFEWIMSLRMLIAGVFAVVVLRSRHLRWMIQDWCRPLSGAIEPAGQGPDRSKI